jgi:hypothetical protein
MNRRVFIVAMFFPMRRLYAFAAERRCSLCGISIPDGERYYRVKGGNEIYCERCYLESPHCSLCDLPAHFDDIDPETGACPRCRAKLPRCRACGKPILGTAYRFRFAQGVFCLQCKNTRPACYVCGVPVGKDYWEYPDGRVACEECGERAVVDIEEIRRIMQDVQSIAEKRLGLKIRHSFKLTVDKLSGLEPLKRDKRGKDIRSGIGLYGKELGLYRMQDNRSEIVLLFGLPPELTYETAAHEYAHAWLADNRIIDIEAELSEGFAQWVAADVLRARNFTVALEKLETRTDSPYGTGYQRLRTMRKSFVLNLMLKKRQIQVVPNPPAIK